MKSSFPLQNKLSSLHNSTNNSKAKKSHFPENTNNSNAKKNSKPCRITMNTEKRTDRIVIILMFFFIIIPDYPSANCKRHICMGRVRMAYILIF
jgi:hypothetical protein